MGVSQMQVPSVRPRTNGMAVASLVLSLVWLLGLGSLLAVIFGHIARKQIKEDPLGMQTGSGLALTGLILGYIGLGFWVLMFVLFAVAAANSPGP